jgi:antitoxin component YwqK of YwqJK toxin-antitoxin module
MKNKTLILLLIISTFGCSNKTYEKEISNIVLDNISDPIIKSKVPQDSTMNVIDIINSDTTQNINKLNGLKQGEIIVRSQNNKIISILNYLNDTLNGYYFNWEGMQEDGFYNKGKKDGYFRTYYGEKEDESVLLLSYYKNNELIWQAHPASDEKYIMNPKGFKSPYDSMYIKAPRINGNIWYEGLFINDKETGKHIIYKKEGDIYAIADYETSRVYFPENLDTLSLKECGHLRIKE